MPVWASALISVAGPAGCSLGAPTQQETVGSAVPTGGFAGSEAGAGAGGAAGEAGIAGMGGATASGGTAGAGGAAGESAGGSAGQSGTGPCPEGFGPPMVLLPAGFCIDSTEVTRAQYARWLATNPEPAEIETSGQFCHPSFGPNSDYFPDAVCLGYGCQGDCDGHPQVCVDWCDARAFCQETGKRLCGSIGGGALAPAGMNDASRSEWTNACSSGGAYSYPYGWEFDSRKCNTEDEFLGGTCTAGSLPYCQSATPAYAGVFDMVGNAAEWVSACKTDQPNICAYVGGAYADGDQAFCPQSPVSPPTTFAEAHDWAIGFRCCADPIE